MERGGSVAEADNMLLLPLLVLLTASASKVATAHCPSVKITSDAFYVAAARFATADSAAAILAATAPPCCLQPAAWRQQRFLAVPFCEVSRGSGSAETKVVPRRTCWPAAVDVRVRRPLRSHPQTGIHTELQQQRQWTQQQEKQEARQQENERQVQQQRRQRVQQPLRHQKRQQGDGQRLTLQPHVLQWKSEENRHQKEATRIYQHRVPRRLPADVSTLGNKVSSRVVIAASTACFPFLVKRLQNICVRRLLSIKARETYAWKAAGSAVQRAATAAAPLLEGLRCKAASSNGGGAAAAVYVTPTGRKSGIRRSVNGRRAATTAAAAAAFLSGGWTMRTGAPLSVTRFCHAARVEWHGRLPRASKRTLAAVPAERDIAVSPAAIGATRVSRAAPAAGAAYVAREDLTSKHACARHSVGVCSRREIRVSFSSEAVARLNLAVEARAPHPALAPTTTTVHVTNALFGYAGTWPLGETAARGFRTAVAAAERATTKQVTPAVAVGSNAPRAAEEIEVAPFPPVWTAVNREAGARQEEIQQSFGMLQMLLVRSDSAICDVLSPKQVVSRATTERAAALTSGDAAAESCGVGSLLLRAHHNRRRNKLGRPYGHRRCLLRNLCTQLLKYGSIMTTFAKAKECKRSMDKVLMLCKQPSLHTYRQALGFFYDKSLCRQLFMEAPERFAYRPHGFCRVEKIPFCRLGDNAEMARVELID